jgi:hypothetical protein
MAASHSDKKDIVDTAVEAGSFRPWLRLCRQPVWSKH